MTNGSPLQRILNANDLISGCCLWFWLLPTIPALPALSKHFEMSLVNHAHWAKQVFGESSQATVTKFYLQPAGLHSPACLQYTMNNTPSVVKIRQTAGQTCTVSCKYADCVIYMWRLSWTAHINNTAAKANRTLNYLKRNLSKCSSSVKESALWNAVCNKNLVLFP